MLSEVFECCGGGASGDLGQGHQFGDGGELPVSGGVSGRGGLGTDPSGCDVAGGSGPYNWWARCDLRVFDWLFNRCRVGLAAKIGLYSGGYG